MAEAKARYETEMLHLTTSLCNETCLLLFPWIFKDEEGRRRDKKTSPPYVELIEELLPENYMVEQELRKRMNEDLLQQMLDEVGSFIVTDSVIGKYLLCSFFLMCSPRIASRKTASNCSSTANACLCD